MSVYTFHIGYIFETKIYHRASTPLACQNSNLTKPINQTKIYLNQNLQQTKLTKPTKLTKLTINPESQTQII